VGRYLESNLATGLDRFEVRRRKSRFGPNAITARQKTAGWDLTARCEAVPRMKIRAAVEVGALLFLV
jgi:hypothetical protein